MQALDRLQILGQLPVFEPMQTLNGMWDETRKQVTAFVKKNGKLPSECSKDPEERRLSDWCANQRSNRKGTGRGKMTPERIKSLEAVPGWFWEQDFGGIWNESLKQVTAFVKKNGKLPSERSKAPEDRKLGSWCSNQRRARKGVLRGKMTPERIKSLEAIPGWYWERDDMWEKTRRQVTAFVKKNGRLPAQSAKASEDRKLGDWCSNQRSACKGKARGKMTPERIKSLESILGWFWEQDFDGIWNETRKQVLAFVKKNRRLPSKDFKDPEERRLSKWCRHQRGNRKVGKMTAERIKSLEAIPGWYWEQDLDAMWNETRNLITAFVKKNRKLPSEHSKDPEEKRLGAWCSNQKSARKGKGKGKMTPERIKSLEAIPGWYWARK